VAEPAVAPDLKNPGDAGTARAEESPAAVICIFMAAIESTLMFALNQGTALGALLFIGLTALALLLLAALYFHERVVSVLGGER
jgi:hypothetical protein